ncbi:polysaccharide deacetylase family protein [Flavobacterium sp. NRK F7]|uniref:polysaccharide deacetylase family protein n=1 Tax=Flavobacterium sp. NRK F7 TaxID=2954930 RepID=UPI002091131B|nr:polysaccharide deacetylase family protein [Flavobacterium sp. NRK F7]MCO6162132.1 polysaccharide deacetylase family protein [Flavobacterium sp. NRK F7]
MSKYWIKINYLFWLTLHTVFIKLKLQKHLFKNRYGERILVFHGINQNEKNIFNSKFISVSYFEKIIQYLTTHFNVISLDDFYNKKFKKNTLNIAITFDDGYANNYKYAIPILEKYEIPAHFFITTIHQNNDYLWADFIDLVSYFTSKTKIIFDGITYTKSKNDFLSNGMTLKTVLKSHSFDKIKEIYTVFEEDWKDIQQKDLNDYWQLMSLEQIQSIHKNALFSFGSHSHTHANLCTIPLDEAKKEIVISKFILEEICKTNIKTFAFPFGYYSDELLAYCTSIGFEKILLVDYTTTYGKNNPYTQSRFVINPYISLENQIAFLLKGSYF